MATPERNDDRNITALLQKARHGDAGSRDELFAACRGYLAVVARAKVESTLRIKVDASDVIQQTMLEAHRDFDRFAGESEKEWLGWLRKILSHNVADFVRHYKGTEKRAVGREVPIRTANDQTSEHAAPGRGVLEPAASGPTPSRLVARLDDEFRVATALAKLSEDYREVIMLRNFQQLPFSEVAEQMNRSRPAVQMLWMRALKQLEELIGEEEE
ncbi:MAG: sigma-70 family RNA polymerase sigma factor [Planctomycetia bacterium]|jgi:RNA polymerase sigma-70 factor (ECF subfamily)